MSNNYEKLKKTKEYLFAVKIQWKVKLPIFGLGGDCEWGCMVKFENLQNEKTVWCLLRMCRVSIYILKA